MKAPENPRYTRFHPRWYRKRMPIFWWVRRGAYTRFVLRELTSLAVGYAVVLLTVSLWMLGRGPEAFGAFQAWLGHPAVLALHTLVLVGLVYHAATWLTLAPKAIVVKVGGRRLSPTVVRRAHQLLGLAATAGVLWLLVGG